VDGYSAEIDVCSTYFPLERAVAAIWRHIGPCAKMPSGRGNPPHPEAG
jgi:hypothetical protein